jgi:predicted DNA-binding transcriptional regulator AlpA
MANYNSAPRTPLVTLDNAVSASEMVRTASSPLVSDGGKPSKARNGGESVAAEGRASIGIAGTLALATYRGERLLSQKAVITITSLSRTEIGRRIKGNRFPKPIAIGLHRIAFREADVRAYVDAMINGEEITSWPAQQAGA